MIFYLEIAPNIKYFAGFEKVTTVYFCEVQTELQVACL